VQPPSSDDGHRSAPYMFRRTLIQMTIYDLAMTRIFLVLLSAESRKCRPRTFIRPMYPCFMSPLSPARLKVYHLATRNKDV
jgi:hypothetical protein